MRGSQYRANGSGGPNGRAGSGRRGVNGGPGGRAGSGKGQMSRQGTVNLSRQTTMDVPDSADGSAPRSPFSNFSFFGSGSIR